MQKIDSIVGLVAKGASAKYLINRIGITESSPREAKLEAKRIADKFGGVVVGSKMGWGTDVAKISKSKAKAVTDWLKSEGYKDVSGDSVYKQLIMHLGSKAWVLANDKITVRVADVDEIAHPATGKAVPVKDLLVNVLYG